jgi:glutaredoxin
MKLDRIAHTLHRAITSETGDSLSLVRVPKDLARRLNRLAGSPIASRDELEARRAAQTKLETLRREGGAEKAAVVTAPVVVYFEKGRNARELGRVEELLKSKDVTYTLSDVTGDDATLSFVITKAKCEKDQLPVVFVAGDAIGRYNDVVAADVSGKLDVAIYGESRRPKVAAASGH